MEPGLYLITDGAWKGKTSLKAGSGIILYNVSESGIICHEFMFELGNYSINKIDYNILNVNIPPGRYNIQLNNVDGYLYNYNIEEYINIGIYTSDNKYPPTNNRAEYIAYILGAILCGILYPDNDIILISDSMLLINTLSKWVFTWIKKNIINEKKNPDLIFEMIKLRKVKKFIHINSHLSPDKFRKLSPVEKEYSKLNDLADELANKAINSLYI
jgi:ribonuclease HI